MNAISGNSVRMSFLVLCGMFLAAQVSADSSYSLKSPDNRIEIQIHLAERIAYDVLLNGQPLVKDSTLSINVDRKMLGENPQVKSTKKDSVDRILEPVVRQKFAKIRERYNELHLEMDGGYAVTFRAYPEGIAYRIEANLGGENVKVYKEEASFRFAGDFTAFYPEEESFFSHNERKYLPQPLKEIAATKFATLPAVVDAGGSVKIAVAESDVEDYPGLWLRGTGENGLSATFEPYPLKEKLERDRDLKVVEAADYIAVTKGTRTFPWRVLGIVERDADLLTNELVWLLEKPSEVQDTTWIKPGKVAWD